MNCNDRDIIARVTEPTASIAILSRILICADEATYIDDDRCDLPVDVTEHLIRAARLDPDVMTLLKRKFRDQIKKSHDNLSQALDDLDLLPRPSVRMAK